MPQDIQTIEPLIEAAHPLIDHLVELSTRDYLQQQLEKVRGEYDAACEKVADLAQVFDISPAISPQTQLQLLDARIYPEEKQIAENFCMLRVAVVMISAGIMLFITGLAIYLYVLNN